VAWPKALAPSERGGVFSPDEQALTIRSSAWVATARRRGSGSDRHTDSAAKTLPAVLRLSGATPQRLPHSRRPVRPGASRSISL